jgi:hypothetical protein
MIVVFFQRTLKETLPTFLINTLLLHIPLLALTAGQNDRGTNTIIVRGLEELFSSCAVVSVFQLWRKIVLGVTYLPYQLCHCVFFCCDGK